VARKPRAAKKQGKRANGEGSLYLSESDGRWYGAVNLEDGRLRRVSAKTQDEAFAKWTALKAEIAAGHPDPPQRQTLGDFLAQWLTDVAAGAVRPSTYAGYYGHLNNHIVRQLGHLQVSALTTERIQHRYAEMTEAGLAPRTVQQVHRILSHALDMAVVWQRCRTNPAKGVVLPRASKRVFPSLSTADAKRFLAKAAEGPHYALYLLALTYGLRRGELLGLRWQDVDFTGATLQVNQTVNRVRGKGVITGEPKSASSRRQLYLTASAANALHQHRRLQDEGPRRTAGALWSDQDLIFPNRFGRPLEGGNLLRRSFWPTLDAAELPRMRLHDLRGTTATLLTGEGTGLTTVRDVLGHSNINVTLDYVRQIPALEREAALRMEQLLGQG
jgi:integrase